MKLRMVYASIVVYMVYIKLLYPHVAIQYQCRMGVGQLKNIWTHWICGRTAGPLTVGRAPVVSNVVRTYGLPPVSRSEAQPLGRKSNLSKSFLVVQLPCDTGSMLVSRRDSTTL